MVRACFTVLAIVGLVASVSPASAQIHGDERRGVWFGLGLAPAQGKCDLDLVCSTATKLGFAGYVHVGGSLSPKVLLGVELNGWVRSEVDTSQQFGMGAAVAVVFPLTGYGLYVKAGAGAAVYQEKSNPGERLVSGNGFAAQFGAGWDFAITNRITIVPFGQYLLGRGWEAKRDRLPLFDNPLDFDLIQLGLGVRWH